MQFLNKVLFIALSFFGVLATQASQIKNFETHNVFFNDRVQSLHCPSYFFRVILLDTSFQTVKKRCDEIDIDLKRNPYYCGDAYYRYGYVGDYYKKCLEIDSVKTKFYKLALEAQKRKDLFWQIAYSLGALTGLTVGTVLGWKCKSFQAHSEQLRELRQMFDPQVQRQNLSTLSEALEKATDLKICLSQMPVKEILKFADITPENKLIVDNLIRLHEQGRSRDMRHIIVCVVGLGLVVFAIIYPLFA